MSKSSKTYIYVHCVIYYDLCHYNDHFRVFEFWIRLGYALQDLKIFFLQRIWDLSKKYQLWEIHSSVYKYLNRRKRVFMSNIVSLFLDMKLWWPFFSFRIFSRTRTCSAGSQNNFLTNNPRLVKKILLWEIHSSVYKCLQTIWDLSKKFLLWEIHSSVHKCQNRLKQAFMPNIVSLSVWIAMIMTIFEFSSCESDQDMLCRISKHFSCKQSGTCQKNICSEKSTHLH